MATAQLDIVLRHIHRAVLRKDGAGRTDAQLLASFIDQRNEAAFEAIVRRHGPMVQGVCHRVAGNHHDAEDAFQATFLVLARKAKSVRPRERLANWLHGVALRTAMKARTMTAKRQRREKQMTEMPEPEAPQQDTWPDVQRLIDQELNGLPENYRLPILLCDLEGKTIKEATQQLGWLQGTLAGRLARGRKMLARRLANRGVVVSATTLAMVVSQHAASASVPSSLVSATTKAGILFATGKATVAGVVPAKVASLLKGVMTSMMLAKLKTIAPGLVLGAVALGGGMLVRYPAAAQPIATPRYDKEPTIVQAPLPGSREETRPPSLQLPVTGTIPAALAYGFPIAEQPQAVLIGGVQDPKPKLPKTKEEQAIQGVWRPGGGEGNGKKVGNIQARGVQVVVTNDLWIWKEGGKDRLFTYNLDTKKSPKQIDLTALASPDHIDGTKGTVRLGIYEIRGDTMRVCESGGERPRKFRTREGSWMLTFKRVGTEAPDDRARNDSQEKPTDSSREEIVSPVVRSPKVRPTKAADQREYVITSRLMEAGAGKPKEVLSFPRLTLDDGQLGPVQIEDGPQNLLVELVRRNQNVGYGPDIGHGPSKIDERIKIGTFFDVRVKRLGGNKLLLSCSFQKHAVDKSGVSEIRVLGNTVQALQEVELHKPVRIILQKDAGGSAQRWIEITVDEQMVNELTAPPAPDAKRTDASRNFGLRLFSGSQQNEGNKDNK